MWHVSGHDRAVRLLQNSIESGRVSHAYLLSGHRHVGKATLAREFAKALNCQQPDRPCGLCRSCRKIEGSTHPDVQFIELEEGAKNISIDAVRGLQSGVALQPFEGRFKVYVIEEAERLSEAAANSLLKTLEEPPLSVVMVLTAQDANLLLPTLVSRCQQLELRPVPAAVVEESLAGRPGVDPVQARVISILAKGRIGWALRAASNPALLEKRKSALARLIDLAKEGRVARFAYSAELATLYSRDQEAVREVLEIWQSWWRDLLLSRLGMMERTVNADLRDRIGTEARLYSVESLGRMVAAIQEAGSLMAQNVNTRLALEVLMLGIPKGTQAKGREW